MTFIEDLEANIDITELVSRYTKLKKAWANYKSLCPFPGHNEKTPSFVVSPSKQIGYCFWCHRWWWPIKFIMDVEWCEFKDAVEILSSITWMKVPWIDFEKQKQNKNIYQVFKEIKNYYKEILEKSPQIQKYLIDRWLSKETINNFDFWYSDSWVNLYNYLKWKWYEDDLIEKTNVFLNLKTKKDKFINRIIFPIKNNRWDIVWFAGRILENWDPKYLNSPASDIYDKSNILYGLFEWRKQIVEKDFVIITEWYMDAISLHQAWHKNTVCVSWTALTDKHITLIKRLTKKVYLCFDSDEAWKKATSMAIEILKNKEIEVKIINLWENKDPDEAIKNWIKFDDFIDSALTPIWFILENTKKTDSIEDKKTLLKKLLEVIKSYNDNIEQDSYLKEISKKLDIKLDIVYLSYNKIRLWKQIETQRQIKKTILTSSDYIIPYLIIDKNLINDFKEKIILKDYLDNKIREILERWADILSEISFEQKEFYKWIASKIDEKFQKETENNKDIEIDKFIQKLNFDLYKKAEKQIKDEINSWNKDAEVKYLELLKIRKTIK